jgi:hypothetical protein
LTKSASATTGRSFNGASVPGFGDGVSAVSVPPAAVHAACPPFSHDTFGSPAYSSVSITRVDCVHELSDW